MYTDVWSLHEGEARWKAGLSAADLHMCQGRFIQAEELAAGIETHCGANQHELLGDVARLRHLALRMSFDFEGSAEWLSRARHLYDAAGSFVGRANAQTNILEQLAFTDPGEAISIADRVIRLHQEAGALHELGKAWTALGVAQTRQGELDAAEVSLCEADQVLRRARYRSGRARAMLFRGMVCLRRGDLQGADEAARESMHRLARAEVYPTLILMGSCLLELMGTVDPCTRAEAERARDAIRATDSTEKIEARMSRLLAVMIHS
jgi:cellobiose-specific phosphotransferase system component IIA